MEAVILSGAEQDIQAAYSALLEFSEQRGGLFLETVNRTLDILIRQPAAGRRFPNATLRSMILHPFPFRLFYKVHGDRLMIGAVLDTRQDPLSLARELRNRTLLDG